MPRVARPSGDVSRSEARALIALKPQLSGGDANMKRAGIGSLLLLALSLGGCVVVPYGAPRRVYVRPAVAVVAPVPVIGVRVYR